MLGILASLRTRTTVVVSLSLSAPRLERRRPEEPEGGHVSAEEQPIEVEPDVKLVVHVSLEMVRLYKDHFGRPKSARTYWAGPDALVVFLEDTLTQAERNMVELGEHDRLRDKRMTVQYSTVREFCEPVERITGRKVRSFLSSTDTEVDGLSMETFVLHPAGYDGPSRIDAEARGATGASATTGRTASAPSLEA